MSGRRRCAWCGADQGPAPALREGETTHGCCEGCKRALLADVAALPVVTPTNRQLPPSREWDEECAT
jgi:hypothetical protein